MYIRRKQIDAITRDLEKKMVIIVGPRQVGKTFIAKEVVKKFSKALYLNWDNPIDRVHIQKMQFPQDLELLVLDEIHKMRTWKSFVKGVFDTRPEGMRILITGSAKLYALKNVGDAMTGRYFAHHIFPLSLAEVRETKYDGDMARLLERGGFPEPFLAGESEDALRWREQYVESNIRAEVLDFASLHDMAALGDVVKILRTRVGSPISYKAIAEDVGVSPITVKRYIQILADLHLIFVVRTYTKKIARSILKETKVYFFDWALVPDEGARLENFVALSLKKWLQYECDTKGKRLELMFIRTKDTREVDFAIVDDGTLTQLIEVKTSDTTPSPALTYVGARNGVDMVQIVREAPHREVHVGGVRVVRMREYLEGLPI